MQREHLECVIEKITDITSSDESTGGISSSQPVDCSSMGKEKVQTNPVMQMLKLWQMVDVILYEERSESVAKV